jgi:catechol 2,3-dioxygenase-like lactoylglutathione lyase family enzyme
MALDKVHHIGISVRDLDRSIEFYREITGGRVLFVNEMGGEGLARVTGEDQPALRFAMVQIGNTMLELIEWQNPKGSDNGGAGVDVGKIHIAFEVPDIQAVYERLQAKGVKLLAPPYTFKAVDRSPDLEGASFAYFLDPDGIGLEIFQPRSS